MVLADGRFNTVVIFETASTTSQGGLAFAVMDNFDLKLGYNVRQMITGRQLKNITLPNTLSKCISLGKKIIYPLLLFFSPADQPYSLRFSRF